MEDEFKQYLRELKHNRDYYSRAKIIEMIMDKHDELSIRVERVVSLPIAETLTDVTRLVVVNWSEVDADNKDELGRIIDKWNVQVKLHLQDDGKTLKVFYNSKRSG